ncbi:hypothetical protein FRC20_002504 [Serendipita sp. 405]|nr:hypothetical protein FRC15_002344 [Serendipita sp. 397]KAG8784616.1 hypothetical protein FRC16_002141 [Serendipita sp. 398]KAG8848682.1 hypothetical protein FRC20_002504 [Serendipita sp. 405]
MKVITLASTILLFTSLGTSSPTPEAVNGTLSLNGTLSGDLTKRDGNGAECKRRPDSSGLNYYKLTTWGPWVNDWGQGFLDNIRGECKANVYNWYFQYYENGAKGDCSFQITAQAAPWCVENAVWDASNPTGAIWGLTCVNAKE